MNQTLYGVVWSSKSFSRSAAMFGTPIEGYVLYVSRSILERSRSGTIKGNNQISISGRVTRSTTEIAGWSRSKGCI